MALLLPPSASSSSLYWSDLASASSNTPSSLFIIFGVSLFDYTEASLEMSDYEAGENDDDDDTGIEFVA
jgi:hypothetical protein